MNVTTLFTYNTRVSRYQLIISSAQLRIAATWLRQQGCKFTSSTDRLYKRTVLTFCSTGISMSVARALLKKHGRKDTAAPRSSATSPRVRKQWVTQVPAAVVQFQPETIADPWTTEEVSSLRYSIRPVTSTPVQLLLAPAKPEVSTNSQLPGGVAHVETELDSTPLYLSPAFATSQQLRSLSNTKLYKLTQTHKIKGRSKLKGNADAMVNALVGLVRKSELKR